MKSIVILFVALVMLLRPLWPVAEYIMNYDYIVNVLCENKDKPELQCDGTCYLAKMLAEQSDQNEKNPFSDSQSKSEIQHFVFFTSIEEHKFLFDTNLQRTDNFKTTLDFLPELYSSDSSQPPEFI